MSLDQIITVQIDRTTTTPTAAGFGTPLIAGYFPTSITGARTQEYSSLAEMVTAGFKAGDPVYLAASAMLAQNPSPPTIKVGRRALAPQQVLEITPTDLDTGAGGADEGAVHKVTVTGYKDVAFASRGTAGNYVVDEVEYTAATSDTATLICDGLRTAFAALNAAAGQAGDWTDAGTATLTITANNTTMDGLLFGVTYTVSGAPRGVNDVTPDPGIATDLAAIALYDPDWYGLCIDSNSRLEIVAAAGWAESAKKQFVAQTQDPAVADLTNTADTDSVADDLEDLSRERTMLFFHQNSGEYICAAMLGRALPEDAGSITWAYKQLSGASSQSLTTTQQSNLEGKNVNFLTTLAGVAVTRYGTSMTGEYMDIIRGTDWLAARIQERVYALLIQNDKLPFTDAGIQAVRGEILAQLQQGIARDFIAPDPEPTCTVPRASAVSAADKGSRTLNDVTFRATLAGAIHKVAIEGELNL
ncbi:MAG: DUF3383 domain-containing protein [Candidatus Tectomicrobia bacterium]|nr:DUF3383 domain-containing protein [Candidatus Tectomicrobia bacterium]